MFHLWLTIYHSYLSAVLMLVIIDNVISVLCCYAVSSPAISHANLSSPYLLSTYSTSQPSLSFYICQAMIVHYCACISYHVKANSFLSAWPPRTLSSSSSLLHQLQSPEHFQAGDAFPTHPLPCGPRRHEEAIRAAVSPERAQPTTAPQGPLQPRLWAARGPIQSCRGAGIQVWTPTRPQPQVGLIFFFSVKETPCVFWCLYLSNM